MTTSIMDYGKEEIIQHTSFNLANTHDRDSHIHFYPEKHIYTFDTLQLTPVSTVISQWFSKFDANMAAERKATPSHPKEQLIEEWDCNGTRARFTGTLMHSQIEQSLLGKIPKECDSFSYHGNYMNVEETICISKELQQFRQFINEQHPIPYRTEWHICDEEHRLAGTIDFLTLNANGQFIMFDWKRSNKIISEDNLGGYKLHSTNNYGRRAFNELSHLYDTSYTHYCLQQNLYRYMLHKHYDIEVEKMYLVILHKANKTYHCVEVPPLDEEITIILSHLD